MEQNFKDTFSELIESLKRSQRAELVDEENNSVLEELYVDPFEGNMAINNMMNDQTTLLIGRKGTGKSTIINKFQHEIRKSSNKISLYIDVRTIYSKSENSNDVPLFNVPQAMDKSTQEKLHLYSSFIKKVIEEIKIEINKNLFEKHNQSWIEKIKTFFSSNSERKISEADFISQLNLVLSESLKTNYSDITSFQQISIVDKSNNQTTHSSGEEENYDISTESVGVDLSSSESTSSLSEKSNTYNYSNILKREFNISDFADNLKGLLQKIGISKVYFCLDDCSELDKEALNVFIKTLVAPLHNDSESFFRFKISFYPERNVLPDIDRTKIDTLHLDYYEMYRSSGADKVEEQAVNFVKRLLQTRLKYYFKNSSIEEVEKSLFDTKNLPMDSYYKIIFYACSCIPRNIGKLLFYCNRKSITQGKLITKSIIEESAKEQYINEVETLITKDEFFQYKSYSEIYKRSQLKELVNLFIERAKENKKRIGDSNANIFKGYTPSNAPSHFLFVRKDIAGYLSTLEINNFITRISEQKDRGDYINGIFYSNDIIVYTINYGLCQKENIIFEEVNNRKYRIERVFDFNKLVEEWANSSAFVECSNCHTEYDISEWEKIKEFDYYCRGCKKNNVCELKTKPNITRQISDNTQRVNLKSEQLRIIHSLYIESDLSENQIAGDLDISPETVRAYLRGDRKLQKEGWVEKNESTKKYCLTNKTLEIIYADPTTNN